VWTWYFSSELWQCWLAERALPYRKLLVFPILQFFSRLTVKMAVEMIQVSVCYVIVYSSNCLFCSVSVSWAFVAFYSCGHMTDCYTPFTQYNRLSVQLYNQFDNRLCRVNKHPSGCQTGLTAVLNEQPLFVQPCWTATVRSTVVKPGLTTSWMFVYIIQSVVKSVWQPVVSCIQTFNWFDNWLDNRLYRVNEALCCMLQWTNTVGQDCAVLHVTNLCS